MSSQNNWLNKKLKYARLFAIIGAVNILVGVVMELFKWSIGFDQRLITSMGILFLGLGLSSWLRYASRKKDPQTALRMERTARDERALFIRTRAGHRGFWVAIALSYGLLMWESLASNGSLPVLSEDARWFWLAAAVVIPFLAYIISIVYDERHY